ncbi:unnamed protein product [Mycena citricolor]|uniref:Uncharacterized protein n=1 Tax=Mycena citricolor TaxID=2018698 RepID=A0AAD2HLY1_9AGAR|nr:unnamed protein product [Mycena citricolor]
MASTWNCSQRVCTPALNRLTVDRPRFELERNDGFAGDSRPSHRFIDPAACRNHRNAAEECREEERDLHFDTRGRVRTSPILTDHLYMLPSEERLSLEVAHARLDSTSIILSTIDHSVDARSSPRSDTIIVGHLMSPTFPGCFTALPTIDPKVTPAPTKPRSRGKRG